MLQPLARTAGAVTFALGVLAALPARADDLHVVIRLYDMAHADAGGRAVAMRTAADAIASAGMRVTWRDCSRGGEAYPCRTVRDAGDLVVRVLPAGAAGVAQEDVQLGFAPVDPSGRGTVVATVYYDVVRMVAQRTSLAPNELLGRAIAHEVGHLLLRAPGHGQSGLMRPLWTDEELMQNRPDDWTFSEADRLRLQAVARESERITEAHGGDSSDTSFPADALGR